MSELTAEERNALDVAHTGDLYDGIHHEPYRTFAAVEAILAERLAALERFASDLYAALHPDPRREGEGT